MGQGGQPLHRLAGFGRQAAQAGGQLGCQRPAYLAADLAGGFRVGAILRRAKGGQGIRIGQPLVQLPAEQRLGLVHTQPLAVAAAAAVFQRFQQPHRGRNPGQFHRDGGAARADHRLAGFPMFLQFGQPPGA